MIDGFSKPPQYHSPLRGGGHRPAEPEQPASGRKKRRWPWVIVGLFTCIILGAAAAAVFYLYTHQADEAAAPKHFPTHAAEILPFPLFFPSSLPKGFSYDQSTVKYTGSVVTYSIAAAGNKHLSITQQKANTDAAIALSKQMKDRKNVDTSNGPAQIGTVFNAKIGTVLAGKTWILVSAPTDFDTDQLATIMKSFRAETE